jgi:acyl-[acyl-carrier-protein] desaturase
MSEVPNHDPLSDNDPRSEEQQIAAYCEKGRAHWPDEPVTPLKRASVQCQMEETFYEHYLRYFQNAEEKRRWNVDTDIPWAAAEGNASELIVSIIESFCAVESFLPDYTSKIMALIRKSKGRALFQANWGYEESKHSLALERWLIASGKRTEDEMEDFERSLLGAEWKLPFETPRQMICYTMIQELATGLNYTNLRKLVHENGEGDPCLDKALRWLSSDESAHYNFFRKGVKTYMALDPEGTIADIKYVFDNFAMPAHALIPEWEKRGAEIEASGIYGPKMYLAKIRKPVLEDLNISRTQLKEAGLPSHEIDEVADRAETKAEQAKQALYPRITSLPAIPVAASRVQKRLLTV